MNCLMCGESMRTEMRDVAYDWSGLDNIILQQVPVHICTGCGEDEVEIHGVEILHRALVECLVRWPAPLNGREIRFLRKHRGWSAKDFADRIGVAPETVSRWENDKQVMSDSHQRLLRLLVIHEEPIKDYRTEELVRFSQAPADSLPQRRFIAGDSGWAIAC